MAKASANTALTDPLENNNSTTVEVHEKEASTFVNSGRLHARNRDYSEAISDLKHATHLDSMNYEAFYYLGLIYIIKKEYTDASKVLKTAIEIGINANKGNIRHCYYKYAFACQNDDQLEEAIKYYTKYITNVDGANKYPGLLNRGICYDKLKQYDAALSDLNHALTLTPDQIKPYCLSCRAKVKAEMNNINGAFQDYDEAVHQVSAVIEQHDQINTMIDTRTTSSSIEDEITTDDLLNGIDPDSPLDILLNGLHKDDNGDSISAMRDYNRLLDEKAEELEKQVNELKSQKQLQTDLEKMKKITYHIDKAKLIQTNVDKHKKAMEKYSANENLKEYYCTIYYKLEEIFTACKTIASGRVKPMEGTLSNIAEVVTLLGEVISIVPVVGEPISLIAQPVTKILTAIDYKRQKNISSQIANLGSTLYLWEISQKVAETLTSKYEPLLSELIPPEEEQALVEQVSVENCYDCCTKPEWWKGKCLKKTKQKIFKEEVYIKQAREIAEYAVALILESLLKQKVVRNGEKSLDQQLIDFVCIPSEDRSKENNKVRTMFSERHILTKDTNKKWTLDGFYHRPGIVTQDQQYYDGLENSWKLYGYRNGTKEEAEQLGFASQK
ncbi:unnamed protein product [Adineta steineri]|uniref:Uncharacterized protein n=1 Tax=Adineta steineri TaxID=433720 RepID=A0A815PWD8_9BILA|nr:unnamed protein product [Adineta steineri]CAF3885786.1 unnamed protein product [Adineta steineri]